MEVVTAIVDEVVLAAEAILSAREVASSSGDTVPLMEDCQDPANTNKVTWKGPMQNAKTEPTDTVAVKMEVMEDDEKEVAGPSNVKGEHVENKDEDSMQPRKVNRLWQCPCCPVRRRRKSHVEDHIIYKHTPQSQWSHTCAKCNVSFPKKSDRNRHTRRCRGPGVKMPGRPLHRGMI